MSSKSKSDGGGNTTQTAYNQQVAASDNAVSIGANAKVGAGAQIGDKYNVDVTNTVTDYGAIQGGLNLGSEAIASNFLTNQLAIENQAKTSQTTVSQVTDLAKLALTKSADSLLADTTKQAIDASDRAMQNALANQQSSNAVQKELAGRIQNQQFTSNEKYAIIGGVVLVAAAYFYFKK